MYVLVFGMAMLAAYMDLDAFFRSQRKSHYKLLEHGMSLGFLLGNGTISVGFLVWAFLTDGTSLINRIIVADSTFGKMVVIGLGAPALVRSKLFKFGAKEQSAGFEAAYDWWRRKVLWSLNIRTGLAKDRLSRKWAAHRKAGGDARLPDDLWTFVEDSVRPFAPAQVPDLKQEWERHKSAYSAPADQETLFRALIRWSMDNVGIVETEAWLSQR